jgi:putative transposase
MPRRPRITLPGVPIHIIQRGNNRQDCFFTAADYRNYLDWLGEYAEYCGCDIHAYALMTNHVHLLVTPQTASATGALMKRLGQRYVQYVNRTYRRSGSLWEGRYRSCITQEEAYVLSCYRYIELNPVRAGMVVHPAGYRWSSYHTNAHGEPSDFLQPNPLYSALGDSDAACRAAYRELFRDRLDPDLIDEIRTATNGNYALGSPAFQVAVAEILGRRVTRGKSGRPRRRDVPER